MKHIIDIDRWSRRGNYEFFRGYANSWYSVTTELECGSAYSECKASGKSFFLRYLHAILCAANEVEAMRYRKTSDGGVVLFDTIDIITPIAAGDNFVTVRIPYIDDFEEFYAEATRIIDDIKPGDNPYGVEQRMIDSGDYDVIHLSAVPKISFTSITFTMKSAGEGCTHPLGTIGKAQKSPDGISMKMPYAIYVDHSFVDGAHLQEFFEKIERRLR